jgi:cell wall-associated NlpC family hydrolase
VPDDNLAPGDVVFFNTFAKLSHVGIYIGNREFIHAPTRGKTVAIDSLDSGYYAKRYVGARRAALANASIDQPDYSAGLLAGL